MSEATVRIDVCICAFARRAGLRHCLQSLAAQVDAPAFRVLIADNHAQLVVPDWIDADSGTILREGAISREQIAQILG